MGKKIPFTILSLIMLSIIGVKAPPASAKMEKDGVAYYTIAEMMELKSVVDAEVEEKYHGGFDCEHEIKREYYERGGQYRALEVADNVGGFMVTNINPGLETITIRYTDIEDLWFRRMGIEMPREEIISLYMVWIDEGVGDPFLDTRYMYNYAERLEADEEIPGVHVVLAKNNKKDDTNWLPKGEEVEFSIAGSDINNLNPSGRIYHKLGGNIGMSISIGTTYLAECLNSPDYEVGMDCKLMIGDDGSYSYKPVPVPKPENRLSIDINATESSEKNTEIEEKNATKVAIPLAPDTGYKTCEKIVEFPWWLTATLIIADFLAMWWLMPTKNQKSGKNLKKSVDKSKPV